jgi:hypothetical protein
MILFKKQIKNEDKLINSIYYRCRIEKYKYWADWFSPRLSDSCFFNRSNKIILIISMNMGMGGEFKLQYLGKTMGWV